MRIEKVRFRQRGHYPDTGLWNGSSCNGDDPGAYADVEQAVRARLANVPRNYPRETACAVMRLGFLGPYRLWFLGQTLNFRSPEAAQVFLKILRAKGGR
jgi:hypothetical protein